MRQNNHNNRRNYYRILHVQPDAPVEIIQASYRALMSRLGCHPDRGGDHAQAALLNEARRVLTDPVQRADYDRELQTRFGQADLSGASKRHRGRCSERAAPHSAPRKPSAHGSHCVFCCAVCPPQARRDPHAICLRCGSPLHPISSDALDSSCRRAVNRIRYNAEIVFFTGWPQERGYRGVIKDLSSQGLCFTSAKSPPEGRIIKVDGRAFLATARTVPATAGPRANRCEHTVRAEFVTVLFGHGTFVSQRV